MRGSDQGAESPNSARASLPTLVRMAAISGVVPTIARFLSAGGSLNAEDGEGRTLLHLAASRGHHALCRLLLNAGASLSLADRKGNDALAMALASGSQATIELILSRVSLVNGSTSGSASAEITHSNDRQWAATATEFQGSASSRVEMDLPPTVPGYPGEIASVIRFDWEAEEEPLPPVGDDACLESAGLIQTRINWHESIDNDSDWNEIEINLPTVRRGMLRYSGLDEDLLLRVAGLLEQGHATGSVPAYWLGLITDACSTEGHRDDLRNRLEMLLGELGIQVVDESSGPGSDLGDGDPLDLPIEVLEFLEDIGTSAAEPLDFYYRSLSQLPLLTKEEEQSFGKMWQDNHDPKGISGLVEGNLRFVVKEARKFRGFGLDLPDLISEGNLGLITAAMRFDPTRENRFLTYAAWWVRQSIFHALTEHGQSIRLPQKVSDLIGHIERKTQALCNELGRVATRQEIADSLSVDIKTVDRLQRVQMTLAMLPINKTLTDLGITDTREGIGIELEPDTEAHDFLEDEDFYEQIDASLCSLSEKERSIICLHFGIGDEGPMTLEQIGLRFDPPISRERVRQLEERAFTRIRDRRREVLGGFLRKSSTVARASLNDAQEFGLSEWEWDFGSE